MRIFLFVRVNEPEDVEAMPRRGHVAAIREETTPPTAQEQKDFFILAIHATAKQTAKLRKEIAAPYSRRLDIDGKKFFGLNAKTRDKINDSTRSMEPIETTFIDLNNYTLEQDQ
jgi:hypothetical protein